jgi:Cft2 family RNA processing exonuclease
MNNMNKNRLKGIYLIHGDYDQQLKLKDRLLDEGFNNIEIPAKGDVYKLF